MEDMNRSVVSELSNENGSANEAVANPETETNTENQVPQGNQVPRGRETDPNMDPMKLRRILASRQYSQKYRLKQLQYIVQLETEVKSLQAEVSISNPRIKFSDRQNALLRAENSSMKQKLSAFSGELLFKEAQYQELKNERNMLKQFYLAYQQHPALVKTQPGENYQLQNMRMNKPGFSQFMGPAGVPQMVNQNLNQFGPGQILDLNSFNQASNNFK